MVLPAVTESEVRNKRRQIPSQEECVAHPDRFLSKRQRKWIEHRLPASSLVHRLMHGLAYGSMKACFRLRVIGQENIPLDQQVIFTPNHTSRLDPPVVAAAIPYAVMRRTRWAVWARRATSNPFTRITSRYAGVVPVHKNLYALAAAAAVLNHGHNLIWFPEGHRTEDGELQRFRRGIGYLLQHFDVPVVPMAICGAYDSMPPRGGLRGFYPIRVVVGKPVHRQELSGTTPAELADSLQQIVKQLTAKDTHAEDQVSG